MRGPTALLFIYVLFFSFHLIISTCSAGDRLDPTQVLRDGEKLRSGFFVLGFFSAGRSQHRYLGIWYNFSAGVVVWVANRNNLIHDSSGVLKITSTGDLIPTRNQTRLGNNNNRTDLTEEDRAADVVWSSNSTTNPAGGRRQDSNTAVVDPLAKLLDSGNLVAMDTRITSEVSDGSHLMWQSFDHMSDVYLPGMKLGVDLKSNYTWDLTSWKSEDDPSVGSFATSISAEGANDFFIYNRNTKVYRSGIWNGQYGNGLPQMTITSKDFRPTYVNDRSEISLKYEIITDGMLSYARLYRDGTLARNVWTVSDPRWTSYWDIKQDECDSYGRCGPNGVCDSQDPQLCRCFTGFRPKDSRLWSKRYFADGCIRKERLNCSQGEGFLAVERVKFPDTTSGYTIVDRSISGLEDCRDRCNSNCSCMAYAAIRLSDVRPRGCIIWIGDLVDTKLVAKGRQDLYLRLPQSELQSANPSGKRKFLIPLMAICLPTIAVLLMVPCWTFFSWRKRKNRERQRGKNVDKYLKDSNLTVFDFGTLVFATSNFSDENVIGQGGFGVVYKGKMTDGEDVAVKRLFKDASRQGVEEFVNEITLIGKLQHRNLVRLLGCCMEGDERIVVYEFMPNRSLDSVIFGETGLRLDWRKRVEIITGIARGLLYLHEDSRLRIIHRDLKAANVLLDDVMNPKICDFGTARIFGANQMEDNTGRVIGTYGYMAPEYAMGGIFSAKSDVFSFGVLMLEIISGRKNRVFYDDELNLLQMAWQLWTQGKGPELVNDNTLLNSSSCPLSDVARFIQIGLLCVQKHAIDRPSMSTVVFMLGNDDGSSLPKPKRPGFNKVWNKKGVVDPPSLGQHPPTANHLTFTTLQPRQ